MTVALLSGSIVAADAAGLFSDIQKSKFKDNDKELKKLKIKTGAKIPTGEVLHGFGVITDGSAPGAAAVAIVTTSHPGVLDSEDQTDINDPVWHNHVVALKGVDASECTAGLAVLDLTNESPGKSKVKSKHVQMKHIKYGPYTGQLAGTAIESGSNASLIVSFILSGSTSGSNICVTPVSSATP